VLIPIKVTAVTHTKQINCNLFALDLFGVGHCCDVTVIVKCSEQAWIIARRWKQDQAISQTACCKARTCNCCAQTN